MNIHTASVGGGSGSLISINPDEITTIFNHLQAIVSDLESNVVPNVKKLKRVNYYSAGKAMKAVEASKDANNKTLDLLDHYYRVSSLVVETLQSMIEADEAIAERIIAALEF